MAYTVLGQDDETLRVEVTEGSSQTVLNIQPAALTITGAVTSVNGQTGAVTVDAGLTEAEVDAKIDALIDGAPGTLDTLNELAAALNDDDAAYDTLNNLITTNANAIALKLNTSDFTSTADTWLDTKSTADVVFGSVTADMYGSSHLNVKNDSGGSIAIGTPVYFKGVSGNKITVGIADADDATKMPAFGIATATANDGANVDIATMGEVIGFDTDTPGWAINDELYVSTTGTLTNTRPNGVSDQVQKIARVAKVHASTGILYVMGAGRSNDIPNLGTSQVFVGNGSGYDIRQLSYTELTNTPTNVSEFTNDAGYLTAISGTVSGSLIPDSNEAYDLGSTGARFRDLYLSGSSLILGGATITADGSAVALPSGSTIGGTAASTFDGAYSSLTGAPTNVSAFTNDAGYLTSETDSQTLSFSNPNLSISNGNSVDLSALTPTSLPFSSITGTPTTIAGYGITDAFDGAYSSLTGTPTIPADVSDLTDTTNLLDTAQDLIKAGDPIIRNTTGSEYIFDTALTGGAAIYSGKTRLKVLAVTGSGVQNQTSLETDGGHAMWRLQANGASDDGTNSIENSFFGSEIKFNAYDNPSDTNFVDFCIEANTLELAGETAVRVGSSDGSNYFDLPNSRGTNGQVLTTDGTGGTSWQDASGGGASALGDLTDVTITSVQNNDLLKYNSTAGEWQNTNLGISVTPTVSMGSTFYSGVGITATITNWATDYDQPAAFCEVYDSGGTLQVSNSNIAVDASGNISITGANMPAIGTDYELRVKIQDFGDLESEIDTQTFDIVAFGGSYRYWRIDNFTGHADSANRVMVANFRLYSASAGGGTAYPSNMTSDTDGNYVATASHTFSSTYAPFKAFDSNTTSTFWWNLGQTGDLTGDNSWIQIDLGSVTSVASVNIRPGQATYLFTGCTLKASSTGAFAGEEVEFVLSNIASTGTTIG
jgi:hypothetical protein